MFSTSTADAVTSSEDQCRRSVADWFAAAGIDADWPITTDQAADLLAAAEYRVDADELRRLMRLGQVPDVTVWDARDLVAAAGSLEARRQWRLTPSVHDPKKSHTRLCLESHIVNGEAGGLDALAATLKGFDLRVALVLMAECDNREMREKLLSSIEGLLAVEGVII